MKASGGDLRVCAHHLEDIVPYTMNTREPGLDKAVGQFLHLLHFVPFGFSVFLVVSKLRRPGNLPLGHDACKFLRDRFCIPRRALTIQLIACENNEIRSLIIENFHEEGRRKVVRTLAWGDNGVAISALGDRSVSRQPEGCGISRFGRNTGELREGGLADCLSTRSTDKAFVNDVRLTPRRKIIDTLPPVLDFWCSRRR